MAAPAFPITPLLPEIAATLAAHPRLVLEAPPGAGKTTQVPLALLDADWLQGRKIMMLEPRRVAARAAAGFMAAQLGEAVGGIVGYRIRFENKVSARTRIEVVTEGILTRMLQDDPALEGVGALLFDEFHERHLTGDLGLALALDVQSQLRPDLRIALMSATLDGERLATFLDAPRLSSAGRSHPVAVSHFAARRDESPELQAKRAVEHALAEHPGDVLVFLPGQREIARVERALASLPHLRVQGRSGDESRDGAGKPAPSPAGSRIMVLTLHGDLPIERQSEVLQPDPHGHRRVILATNVAESSVTLPGVRVVIDSGLAREPRYDPNTGFSRLESVAISQASADQRAGRAGRVAEGWAYRLWPQSQRLEPQRRAEIMQVDLSSLALELAAWGASELRFVDAPPTGAMAAGRDLLLRLGALALRDGEPGRSHAITPLGRRMLALGTHPRLAAMLLSPADDGERALACDLAALVEARDPMQGPSRTDALIDRWNALSALRSGLAPHTANRAALSAIDQAARQWRRRLRIDATPARAASAHLLGDVLAHAFPDRIARQHAGDPRRYQLANGRMARLLDDSALYGERWLVVSELTSLRQAKGERTDALILRAAPLDEARLQRDFPQRFTTRDLVRWDDDKRAIVAQRESRFDEIVLEVRPLARPDPSRHAGALVDAVRLRGLDGLPWTHALSQWRERVRCLRDWLPELGLPDLSDVALLGSLDDWLAPAFAGKTRLDALGESGLAEALSAHATASGIDWTLRQRIDALAPPRMRVPSGLEREIAYRHGEAPVLAVKLQELFGLADTPSVAGGRVPLTIHLLSPAGRPLQVTQDLRGFWERTYPEVRREMKGRYPKHPWPDDPSTAVATHRAKPRGT